MPIWKENYIHKFANLPLNSRCWGTKWTASARQAKIIVWKWKSATWVSECWMTCRRDDKSHLRCHFSRSPRHILPTPEELKGEGVLLKHFRRECRRSSSMDRLLNIIAPCWFVFTKCSPKSQPNVRSLKEKGGQTQVTLCHQRSNFFNWNLAYPWKNSSLAANEIKYLTTHFRIPLCKSLAFDGREDRNSLKKDTILPRFFATLEIKQKTNN